MVAQFYLQMSSHLKPDAENDARVWKPVPEAVRKLPWNKPAWQKVYWKKYLAEGKAAKAFVEDFKAARAATLPVPVPVPSAPITKSLLTKEEKKSKTKAASLARKRANHAEATQLRAAFDAKKKENEEKRRVAALRLEPHGASVAVGQDGIVDPSIGQSLAVVRWA